MEIIDNFYNAEQFNKISYFIDNFTYKKTYQPSEVINNKEDGYPCYETEILKPNNYIFQSLVNSFKTHKNINVKMLKTYIRKTYLYELKDSNIFKKSLNPHQDKKCDLAGVVYLNTNDINDGTIIYENESLNNPSIIVGSKINRCLFYKNNIWHQPNLNQTSDVRIIQPFFLDYD